MLLKGIRWFVYSELPYEWVDFGKISENVKENYKNVFGQISDNFEKIAGNFEKVFEIFKEVVRLLRFWKIAVLVLVFDHGVHGLLTVIRNTWN